MADQLTLFEPGWAGFAPHTIASPLGFKKLSTPLVKVKEHDKIAETIIDIVDLEIEDKLEPVEIGERNNNSTKLTDIPKESMD